MSGQVRSSRRRQGSPTGAKLGLPKQSLPLRFQSYLWNSKLLFWQVMLQVDLVERQVFQQLLHVQFWKGF